MASESKWIFILKRKPWPLANNTQSNLSKIKHSPEDRYELHKIMTSILKMLTKIELNYDSSNEYPSEYFMPIWFSYERM